MSIILILIVFIDARCRARYNLHTMTVQDVSITHTQSTRWAVIRALRALGRATVAQLAEQVGVKEMTIRHHLNSLHAEGLVTVEEQRRAVGRPVHLYRLTEEAERLFPHAYHLLIDHLLDLLKQKLAPATVQMLLEALAHSLADEARREAAHLPAEERRAHLEAWLREHGLIVSWQQTDDGMRLVKYHCPYYIVGQRHPELCQVEETLIRAVLEAEVQRAACLLAGDGACTFVLQDGERP